MLGAQLESNQALHERQDLSWGGTEVATQAVRRKLVKELRGTCPAGCKRNAGEVAIAELRRLPAVVTWSA